MKGLQSAEHTKPTENSEISIVKEDLTSKNILTLTFGQEQGQNSRMKGERERKGKEKPKVVQALKAFFPYEKPEKKSTDKERGRKWEGR